jgi:hypothetical protein
MMIYSKTKRTNISTQYETYVRMQCELMRFQFLGQKPALICPNCLRLILSFCAWQRTDTCLSWGTSHDISFVEKDLPRFFPHRSTRSGQRALTTGQLAGKSSGVLPNHGDFRKNEVNSSHRVKFTLW